MKGLSEILKNTESAKVISNDIDYADYVPLSLSVNNEEITKQKIETAKDYEHYIQKYLEKSNSKIAYGGYKEHRNLYQRSTVFKNQDNDERNIHIGLDLWINESAPVYAALDGTIHSFLNNDALGDYGPTIILKHQIEHFTFHTLYGHLSMDSLDGKKTGTFVKKGQQIATLGMPPINGDYAPHLHFQIIIDMVNKVCDYPGVCNQNRLAFYLENCPDPDLLLKIKT